MSKIEDLLVNSQTKLDILQGHIELLTSLVVKKTGKEEFFEHLKFAVNSPHFGKEAKLAASEILRQESLWTPDMHESKKQ